MYYAAPCLLRTMQACCMSGVCHGVPTQRYLAYQQRSRIICHVQNLEVAAVKVSGQGQHVNERGAVFQTGPAFYRAESAQSRDLAVLAAALHSRRKGRGLRVLDAMAGSGTRGARYAQQAGAQLVWCNDIDTRVHDTLASNLLQAAGIPAITQPELLRPEGLRRDVWQWSSTASSERPSLPAQPEQTDHSRQPSEPGPCTVRVSHVDASRLLASCWMSETYFDVVDVDSFGSETSHLGHAIDAVSYDGGLLYLTSTDGFSSGGLRPARSLAAYGAYLRALPYANEQGLRMLIGAAVKEAAAKGVCLTPVFSLYSFHGPVFRVMLRAQQGREWPVQHYGFVGYCHVHGNTYNVDWKHLSSATCRCCGKAAPGSEGSDAAPSGGTPLVLSGPMWTGPLHSAADVAEMAGEAAARGWAGHGVGASEAEGRAWAASARSKKNHPRPLEEVLQVMLEEADPRLPVGFTSMDDIARHLSKAHPKAAVPGRDALLAQLGARGHAAARCHLDTKSIRTNARMHDIVAACVEAQRS